MKRRSEDSAVHNAVIYARYSSNNQRDVSIDQQVDKCREFAERISLVDLFKVCKALNCTPADLLVLEDKPELDFEDDEG